MSEAPYAAFWVAAFWTQPPNSRTSSERQLIGSPQEIILYDNEDSWQAACQEADFTDEFDHTIGWLRFDRKQVFVRWFNKAGPIQFCGSGAYALAWSVLPYVGGEMDIVAGDKRILATLIEDRPAVKIHFSSRPWQAMKQTQKGQMYQSDSVYALRCEKHDLLDCHNWYRDFLRGEQIESPGAFVAFSWDDRDETGYVRYFTPWYGRDEDHVTGSVHQWLTPLIAQETGCQMQNWIQLSNFGGALKSRIVDGGVCISGICTGLVGPPEISLYKKH